MQFKNQPQQKIKQARASARCYLVAPGQVFLATLGSSFSKLEASKPAAKII
jgi:hypothetical protein